MDNKADGSIFHFGLDIHQVYYLVKMGYIEAIQVGRAWRVVPESAKAYIEKKAA